MLDMSDAFDGDTMHTVVIRRPSPARYVDGYPVRTADTVFTDVLASVQPIKSQNQTEWMRLPEGIRNEAECTVITPFDLQSGDILEGPSGHFRVLSIDNWRALGGYTLATLGGLKP